MAHFAKIENSQVVSVIVINNEILSDGSGLEREILGVEFIHSLGLDGEWIQTSYNASFRGKYAGIGDIWDGVNFTPAPESLPTP